jgi:uroporphyrin-III C-methyltransferase / precorrin-2 dehydrogenase / sirohydrochlorin ferrochelatase
MNYFPVFLDLRDADLLFIGGTDGILAKLRLALKTKARLTVIADVVEDEIRALADAGRLSWRTRFFEPADLAAKRIVYISTGSPVADMIVSRFAREAGLLVNVVDDPANSNTITAAMVDRDPLVIAIGTEGAAPVLARRIKAELEERLSPRLGNLVAAAARLRARVSHDLPSNIRRSLWDRFFSPAGEAAEMRGEVAIEAHFNSLLAGIDTPREGRVILVGAGPGDPELLTLKARKALHEADVILYDRLVDSRILELARREAKIIEVGKTSGKDSSWKQADIEALMIDEARSGATVIRLKSGDPMVFGRADEEIAALDAAGITTDVIPGITAAVAASAALKQSLTRRGRNSSFTFLTARDVQSFAEYDWTTLAAQGCVCAIYMGVEACSFVQGRLLDHGAAPDTPVHIVENISRINQVICTGTLDELSQLVHRAGIHGPAIIFIGLAKVSASLLKLSQEVA